MLDFSLGKNVLRARDVLIATLARLTIRSEGRKFYCSVGFVSSFGQLHFPINSLL